MRKSMKVVVLVEVAMMIALTATLEIIFSNFGMILFPQGGSISVTALPLMILSIRRGFKVGLFAGLIYGIFQFILPVPIYFLTPIQYMFDYVLPYVFLAFVAIFKKANVRNLSIGAVLAGVLKYLSHVIAGIAFWGEYAPESFNATTWSFYYNATYSIPSIILCWIIIIFIYKINELIVKIM